MFKMDSFLENKDFYEKKVHATYYVFQLFLHIYKNIYVLLFFYCTLVVESKINMYLAEFI